MMNYCALALVIGSLISHGGCVFPAGSCDGYANITEPWRNRGFSSTFFGYPTDDTFLLFHWWRFTGIGGDRVITDCHGEAVGGTYHAIYIPFEYPGNMSEKETHAISYVSSRECPGAEILASIVRCPGEFYVYQPLLHSVIPSGYVTYHSVCNPDSCGPLAECHGNGSCTCISGYEIPTDHKPTIDSYGCTDIDECQAIVENCGPDSSCNNTIGSFNCICLYGFIATDPTVEPRVTNQCIDIDECLDDPCGIGGNCVNEPSTFKCECYSGFLLAPEEIPQCQDIDECFNSTLCGPESVCTNLPGDYSCACLTGFIPINASIEPNENNTCIDIDECFVDARICGPEANCTNTYGSHNCTCLRGYRPQDTIPSRKYPCIDIDECSETPTICGKNTVCNNIPGSLYCSCPEGFFPSSGVTWIDGVSYCENIQGVMDAIVPKEGQSKAQAFLENMDQQLQVPLGFGLPEASADNFLTSAMEVSGVGPRVTSDNADSEGDADTGMMILGVSDRVIFAMASPTENATTKSVNSSTVALSFRAIGPKNDDDSTTSLSAKGQTMEINLQTLADTNNGSAAAGFMTLCGMESLLSHRYFKTENKTEMYSDVFTAVVPSINTTNLTEAVNFTIQHKKKVPESGMVTCVYWEGKSKDKEEGQEGGEGTEEETRSWSVEGCWVAYTDENYTVCSCSHLSTFALIMQIGEPAPEEPFLEWLNRMCVIVGLFFLALAIFTFLLCSWNPKVNNTARLNLCLSLFFSHLLLLWNDRYVEDELACIVMAGLLHFIVIASFVWMQLEALQLYLLVRRLTKVQVIQKDGLPRPVLYLIGYGVPFVIVGVSALVYSDGYGDTGAGVCWLSQKRHFNWALTGPVITVLALNCMLFCATLWSLRATLANMKSGTSQSKDARLVVFKIVAQFIIVGCTWILGLYQANLFFQVLFIILNSQQGTFLFIVHCVLNKEVREEYIKWLRCAAFKSQEEGSMKDAPSFNED